MTRGLFLGKFLPLHNGHLFVCDVARRQVDRLTVLLCSYDAEPIPGALRAQWMRESLVGCDLVHMHRDIPQEPKDHPEFWRIWKEAIFEMHPEPLDYVFGSEDYIYQLAETVGAKPFVVDLERRVVPVSATAVREDPAQVWAHIPRAVQRHYRKRITLLGPESTGKSTLSEKLAERCNTQAIPEYGRDYDATFKQGSDWTAEDFSAIAKGHRALATAIAERAGPLVFEDTDLLQTVVWAEALLGEAPAALVDQLMEAPRPDLYLLLNPEMDWIDDGTRYHASLEERQWFYARLEHWLTQTGAPWRPITGASWAEREAQAVACIETLRPQKAA